MQVANVVIKQSITSHCENIYYLGSHKMKGTAHALFGVAKCHRLITGHDTRNKGMMLITGTVTLVTWLVTLVTCSYMRKNGSEAPGQDAVGMSWSQGS